VRKKTKVSYNAKNEPLEMYETTSDDFTLDGLFRARLL